MRIFITVAEASRTFGINVQTILAMGRRGIIDCRDYWRSPGGRITKGWRSGYRKQWHVKIASLIRLQRIKVRDGIYASRGAQSSVFLAGKE